MKAQERVTSWRIKVCLRREQVEYVLASLAKLTAVEWKLQMLLRLRLYEPEQPDIPVICQPCRCSLSQNETYKWSCYMTERVINVTSSPTPSNKLYVTCWQLMGLFVQICFVCVNKQKEPGDILKQWISTSEVYIYIELAGIQPHTCIQRKNTHLPHSVAEQRSSVYWIYQEISQQWYNQLRFIRKYNVNMCMWD